jgi:hypothetical protein
MTLFFPDILYCVGYYSLLLLLLQDRMRRSTGTMATVGYGAANRFGFRPDAGSYGR